MLKGDALVTYLKEASVALALDILDGSFFRWGRWAWLGGAGALGR
jgi:hypothetical protein